MRVRGLYELHYVEGVLIVEVHAPPLEVLTHDPFLLADRSRLAIDSLQDDSHHLHLALAQRLEFHGVLGHALVCLLLLVLVRCLQALDDSLAVRVLLLVELALHLLRIEVLQLVGLEVEAGEGLKSLLMGCGVIPLIVRSVSKLTEDMASGSVRASAAAVR